MTDADSDRSLDLAIVGMAGRFPGARNVEALWDLLIGGREGITRFSDDELLANGVSPATLTDPAYVRAAASLDDVDRFDAAFFGIPAEYAQVLDPQQRVFLEEAWHAFEDAGYVARSFDGLVGVYAGADMSTYMFNNVIVRGDVVASMDPLLIGLANDKDSLATRVGYMFDLRGPCFSIQSYCSTSLVAVCTAATGLLNGECDLALAGGISIGLPDDVGYVYEDNGMKSPDGRCRAFDADAEGTPMGSGVGIVVLRRLDDALRDGDSIRAVLRGWAVTNDGGLKVGYTAPGVRGQAAAITEAIAAARIDSTSIDYIEAHGSGTPLGDSVEIASLQRVFGEGHNVAIGSVKTNIGHLNHASGVTGLIKTVLSLEHGVIPKTLHFNEPNPQLLNPPSLHVVSEATPWPATDHPPRAGVSSFGIGGTNAHVIVERAPEAPRDPAPRRHHLLAWSARSAAALDELTDALATHVGSLGDADVIDTSFTLLAGREHFQHRRCLVTSSAAGAAELLGSADRRGTLARVEPMSNRPTALLIAGVGEQYEGMAADLYATEPLFRSRLDEYRAALRDMIGTDPVAPFVDTRSGPPAKPDLRALMGRGDGAAAAETSAATETLQPALFV
ncbi:MAG TPA: beta-ketoacyl synthase N-terminal-like domain-containing protein, partial [Acidimicrobiales bacterium]|nr:beta-ketoacyl synthase N-terminal-like domain-containing protein [Acidimicrobiales bacterium]